MNRSTTLRRKLIYLVILVVALIPLYLLGQPVGGGGEGGGQLARMRDTFEIAESDLGEISPASETMKLASLGLRGVAASLLWNKAHEYKVMHEWDRLKATLNNIALLQPHFDKVWEFQAHNLAYNVSVEFDDYRQRYEMVREGTEFLTKGVKQNRKAPRLIWYTGWFYGQKMGMSDEKRQFRRLFADDDVLHEHLLEEGIAVDSPEARGPLGKPDNWLVGRLWLNTGYDVVESGVQLRRQSPLNFYETGPKWRIKHAEAIEKEGILDERAQNAWQMGYADWVAFGNRSVPTTASFTIKLGQLDELIRQQEEKIERLQQLAPDAYAEAQKSMIDQLPPIQRDALQTPEEDRTASQQAIAENAQKNLVPDYDAVARNADSDVRFEAVQLASDLRELKERQTKTESSKRITNYDYWRTLALAEQEERTVRARRLVYEAEKANAQAELDEAIGLYEEAFAVWAKIFDDYPILVIDDSAQDLFESIKRYRIAIDRQELPDEFPLKTFVDLMGEYGQVDQEMYEEVRKTQQERAEARQKELAKEERRRAEDASMTEPSKEPQSDDSMPSQPSPEEKDASEAAATESEPDDQQESTSEVTEENADSESPKPESSASQPDNNGTASEDSSGDSDVESDTSESDTSESNSPESDASDSDTPASDVADSDTTNSDTTNSDTSDSDASDSDASEDGDSPEDDLPADDEPSDDDE